MNRRQSKGRSAACIAALLCASAGVAAARTIYVNTTAIGSALDGKCSLEEAVYAVMEQSQKDACPPGDGNADKIQLEARSYAIDFVLPCYRKVTIAGKGMTSTTITSGSGEEAIQIIDWAGLRPEITLRDLSLKGKSGNNTTGIFLDGRDGWAEVHLYKAAISGFNASGIWSLEGFTEVRYSRIENNQGIYLQRNGVYDRMGGGIANEGLDVSGQLFVENSHIINNKAAYGAGIFNKGYCNLRNTTVAKNMASKDGGGIHHSDPTLDFDGGEGYLEFYHATVAENTAGQRGGGLFGDPNATNVNRYSTNSIFARNTAPSGPDVFGRLHISNENGEWNNIIRNTSGFIPDPMGNDFLGADPKLGTLGSYGGNTRTYPLNNGSRAIDRAIGTTEVKDQRGTSRPRDGDGNGSRIRDIGAFEK